MLFIVLDPARPIKLPFYVIHKLLKIKTFVSLFQVENIELDSEREKETKQNGETENSDSREVDVDSLKDLEDEDVHLKSVVENPDMRRESIAEIKRLAEEIVQKGT